MLLALLGATIAWLLRPAPVSVETALVTRGRFEQSVDEQAKTRIRNHYLVTAPLSGEVDRIELREGDMVASGQLLAQLHPVLPPLLDRRTEMELRSRVEAARAAKERAAARIERAQVAVERSQLDLDRRRKLAAEKLIAPATLEAGELDFQMSVRELDTARAEAHVATHDIDTAEAALARVLEPTGRDSSVLMLRAPVAGRVLRVQQKSRGTVAIGAALLELGDPADLEVVVELLTTEAPQVTAGAHVRLDNWGGPPLAGLVRRVEPWGFTKISALGVEEQRVNVLVDIVSPLSLWRTLGEGYRMDAHIRVYQAENALIVPSGALYRSGMQWEVYVIRPPGRARRTTVNIGHRTQTAAEVLAGLRTGEEVILYPSDAITDGTRVVRSRAPR